MDIAKQLFGLTQSRDRLSFTGRASLIRVISIDGSVLLGIHINYRECGYIKNIMSKIKCMMMSACRSERYSITVVTERDHVSDISRILSEYGFDLFINPKLNNSCENARNCELLISWAKDYLLN